MGLLIVTLILLGVVGFIHFTTRPAWSPPVLLALVVLALVAAGFTLLGPGRQEQEIKKGRVLHQQRVEIQAEYLGRHLASLGTFKKAILMSDRSLPDAPFYEKAFARGAGTALPTVVYSGASEEFDMVESEMSFIFTPEDVVTAFADHQDADLMVWCDPPHPQVRHLSAKALRQRQVSHALMNHPVRRAAARLKGRSIVAAVASKPLGERLSDQGEPLPSDLQKAFDAEFILIEPEP